MTTMRPGPRTTGRALVALTTAALLSSTLAPAIAAARTPTATASAGASAGALGRPQPPAALSLASAIAGVQTPRVIDGRVVEARLTLRATAYGPSAQDNYPYGATDYYGQPLQPGMVAVDPTRIPLGSRLYITGYQSPDLQAGGFLATALDTGGAIRGNRVDIFMNAGAQAVSNFGVQTVTAYLLGPSVTTGSAG